MFFYLSLELSWCRVSFLKVDLQFSKFLKNTICIGLCKLKCTEKRFIPFSPLHFLPEFVPNTEFKGRPEDTKWIVLYHTALRNYAAISLQVPSILSILLGFDPVHYYCQRDGAKCILFSVVFTPPPTPTTTAVFGSYLSSFYS